MSRSQLSSRFAVTPATQALYPARSPTAPSTSLDPEDFVIALALSSLARHHRGLPRGLVCVRESRVEATRRESDMRSTGVHVSRESAAHPGGFGTSDHVRADLAEVRSTNRDFNERRVRAGPPPLRG
jgi:hypothetical protein